MIVSLALEASGDNLEVCQKLSLREDTSRETKQHLTLGEG